MMVVYAKLAGHLGPGWGKPRRAQPEQQIQKALFTHIRARAQPGMFAFHVPNGGYRRKTEAAILKGLGVKAGVPDVICIHRGKVYALELKAAGGRLSPKQRETTDALREAGATVRVATGLDDALKQLELWGLLRGAIA
jgi:hypothetical protein